MLLFVVVEEGESIFGLLLLFRRFFGAQGSGTKLAQSEGTKLCAETINVGELGELYSHDPTTRRM